MIVSRRKWRLSGWVGEEIRRIEATQDGSDRVEKRRPWEVKEGGNTCVPGTGLGGGVMERKKRRGGRVSNLVKTLEQGAKQANKISFYTKREDGPPSASRKLCVNSDVWRYGSECSGSATKRQKLSI